MRRTQLNEVLTVLANDYQGTPISTFSITGGDDAGEFWIDSGSGELWFNSSPDYEAPLDANVDNFYEVEIQADDMIGNVATQLITVEVTDANDDPIEISFFSDTESSDEYRFTDQNGLIGLTVMLSSVPATDVTVDFDVFDDMAGMYPAVVADDLVDSTAHPLSDTLTFSAAASEVSKHITFEIFNDGIDEYDETFIVQLSNPSLNAQFVGGTSLLDATGTILDDDSAPSVTIDNNLTTNEGGISAAFTITLSHESEKGVDVDWQAVTGTVVENPATMPTDPAEVEDFEGMGMESFGSSETTRTIYVNITDDDKDEYDEFFEVQITSATNATIADSLAIGAILDNDSTPFITIDNNLTIGEGDGTGTFTITLSRASEKGVEVAWYANTGLEVEDPLSMPSDPAETDDFDISAVGNEIFGNDETSRTIDVAITDDLKDEYDEFFEIQLGSPLYATILDSLAIGGILNDDGPPDLVIGTDPTFSEPAAVGDTSTETITVDLSVESEKPIEIQYVVRAYDTNPHNPANPEWAELNDDFTPTSGTLNFNPGDTSMTFNVTLKGDDRYEYDEVFKVVYSEPFPFDEPVNIPNDTLVVTIEDEDVEPTISATDEIIKEGTTGTVVISLSHPTEQANQVIFVRDESTALNGFDFQVQSVTHTFGPNDTTLNVSVPVYDDGRDEPTESIRFWFSYLSGLTLGTEGVGTIPEVDLLTDTTNDSFIDKDTDDPWLGSNEAVAPGNMMILNATEAFEIYVADVGGSGDLSNFTLELAVDGVDIQLVDSSGTPVSFLSYAASSAPASVPVKGISRGYSDVVATLRQNGTGTVFSTDRITFQVLDLFLKAVDFNANHDIDSDPISSGSTTSYTSDYEWLDTNGDGVISGGSEHAWPVGYSRSDTFSADAIISISGTSLPLHKIKVRANSTETTMIYATETLSGFTLTAAVSGWSAFGGGVRHIPNFNLTWEISLDGGNSYAPLGTSVNPLYITYEDPVSSPVYHTVIHVGTVGASGATNQNDTITGAFSEFTDHSVSRMDGTLLTYGQDGNTTAMNLAGLLADGRGQCKSWSEFFHEVLRAQGISSSQMRQILPIVVSGVGSGEELGFLINNVNFYDPPQNYAGTPDGFDWKSSATQAAGTYKVVSPPMPFQGKGHPQMGITINFPDPAFLNHWVVQVNGSKVYDPAYGIDKPSRSDWENATIAGLIFIDSSGTQYGKERTGTMVRWAP